MSPTEGHGNEFKKFFREAILLELQEQPDQTVRGLLATHSFIKANTIFDDNDAFAATGIWKVRQSAVARENLD